MDFKIRSLNVRGCFIGPEKPQKGVVNYVPISKYSKNDKNFEKRQDSEKRQKWAFSKGYLTIRPVARKGYGYYP